MFRFVWFQSWIFTLQGGPFVLLPMDFQGCRFRCWDEFDPPSPYPMEWEKRWPRQRNWNKWVSSGVCVCVLRNMFQQTIPVSINLKNIQQTHKTQIINWTHTTWTNRSNLDDTCPGLGCQSKVRNTWYESVLHVVSWKKKRELYDLSKLHRKTFWYVKKHTKKTWQTHLHWQTNT